MSMLLAIIPLFLCQVLLGSSYVVMEENGFYTSWSSTPKNSQITKWSLFTPQFYSPFWNNFNSFFSLQPYYENLELNVLRANQRIILNTFKCLLSDEKKEICKKLLESATTFIQQPEITVTKLPTPTSTVNEIRSIKGEIAEPAPIASSNQSEIMITAKTEEINSTRSEAPQIQPSGNSQLIQDNSKSDVDSLSALVSS